MKGKLIYTEKQTFRNTFFWWLQAVVSLGVIGTFAFGLSKQIISGEPWGDKPMSDTALSITSLVILIILGAIQWLFTVMNLTIEIDHNRLYYSYYPFVIKKRSVSKSDLESMVVRKYQPIMEYGGWGYRVSLRNGKAFNINGNWGLQLVLKGNKKLLLGTQKPEQLKSAIEQLKRHWNEENYG